MDMMITEEMLEAEKQQQKEREEAEEAMWAHDPYTGERTFYLGCLV